MGNCLATARRPHVDTNKAPIRTRTNIQTLPKQVKDIVNTRYHMLTDFKPTLNYMNNADRDSKEIRAHRKQRILQTDKYRNENFGHTFPLLNKVLQIYE